MEKLPSFSKPQFPFCKMGETVPTYSVLGFGFNPYAGPGTGDW